MRVIIKATSASGAEQSSLMEVDAPCTVELEIGKRFVKYEVDAKEGVRVKGDSGGPEDVAQ